MAGTDQEANEWETSFRKERYTDIHKILIVKKFASTTPLTPSSNLIYIITV